MRVEFQEMSELVDLLNEEALQNQDNPVSTTQDFPVIFLTDMFSYGAISVNDTILVETHLPTENTLAHNFPSPMTKLEMLDEIEAILNSWLSSVYSLRWAAHKTRERLTEGL